MAKYTCTVCKKPTDYFYKACETCYPAYADGADSIEADTDDNTGTLTLQAIGEHLW